MPELPEVEVVRRGLARWVSGRTVAEVDVAHPRAVRRHLAGAEDFAARLKGATLGEAHRRGKYLWLPLGSVRRTLAGPAASGTAPRGVAGAPSGNPPECAPAPCDAPHQTPRPIRPRSAGQTLGGEAALLAHLGMSGQLLVQPHDAPAETHLRIRIRFDDELGTELRFVDQRTFGGLSVHESTPQDGVPVPLSHIALDPLDAAFDEAAFHTALRRRRTTVKRALLDQSLISGVGNIYADEALWRTRLHYERPTATLTRPVTAELLTHIREVMGDALAAGGTSFDSLYVNVNGESGYFDRSLDAYGREGEPCARCGTPIRRRPWMNRSSYYCPRCQRPPRASS